jgi:hypothetical protein
MRLDRLLGAREYKCQWRQNSYIIEDAPRTLNPVSATLPFSSGSLACDTNLSADRNCWPSTVKIVDVGHVFQVLARCDAEARQRRDPARI